MAVAFGSSSSTTYASRTNTTVTAPSGIANGDLLIAQIITAVSGTPADPTPPAGWTQIGADGTQGDGGFNIRICIWYKIANSEAGNYTWTHAANSSQGQIHRYTGVDQTNPINVSSSRHELVSGTTRTADGVTTTVANCMLCYIGWDWADNTTNETPPTGFTERQDATLNYWADALQAAAGASGNKTNTCNSASNSPRGAHLVALAPATGTHYTIVADTAAYSISGTAASLEVGREVAADTASYSISGTDASLEFNRKLAADTAAYNVSGNAVDLLRTRIIPADSGAYNVSGSDVTFLKSYPIAADTGVYSLSGTDSNFLHSQLIIADITAYSISGSDASFLQTYVIAADSASYTISGTAAGVFFGREVIASSDSYAINGAAASFLLTHVIAAASASYTVGGSEAELLYSASPPADSNGWMQVIFRRRRRA